MGPTLSTDGEKVSVVLTAEVWPKIDKLPFEVRGMDKRQRAEHDRFLLGGEAKENRKKVSKHLATIFHLFKM